MQSKLNEANAATLVVQSQLDKAKADSAQVQSQFELLKSASAQLQSELAQAKAGSDDLQSKLDQAKAGSSALQAQLAGAQAEVSRLRPLAEKPRPMPIATLVEKSGGSYSLNIKNQFLEPLRVDVTISRGGVGHPQSDLIEGGGSIDLEKLARGDSVQIANPDFDTVKLIVK